MARNVYDQAARYAAKLDAMGFVRWLLGMPSLLFLGWLDTRRMPFPGEADRICDTVACLEDPAVPGMVWAVPVEFALEPEADLFGRLLSYLGLLWLEMRPTQERGSRYNVGAAVVNLTGQGHTSRDLSLAGMRTCLQVEERDLAGEDAASILAGIASGGVARCLLPLVPLMQGGAEAGIIQQWVQLASAEPDARRRGDYAGLALVFAEAANCRPAWRQALQGWNVVQSQQVLEWMAEGETRGEIKGKVGILLRVLRARFGAVPGELEASIRAQTDLAQLDRWADAAAIAPTLDDFRQTTGL
jgi:hypothetical protein